MKRKQTFFYGFLAILFTLTFAACPDNVIDDLDNPPSGISVAGSTLAEKLAWVLNTNNVENGKTYLITVNADEAIGPQTLSYTNMSDITIILYGGGNERVISLSSNGSLFTVGSGVTLVLDKNITLQGRSDNATYANLVQVSGGDLIMETGAKITGNTSSLGGGVRVSNGTFTMNGGEISGNTSSSGGGVYLSSNATFTMNGGEISGNEASSAGGGVYLSSGENATFNIFNMNGGKISRNISGLLGGGVCVMNGTFNMNGGEISGNKSASYGGGVQVSSSATFRIVTGTVYGSNAAEGLRNTAGSANAALANSGTSQYGTFSGTQWTSNGTLTSTNNTINVVNGVFQPPINNISLSSVKPVAAFTFAATSSIRARMSAR